MIMEDSLYVGKSPRRWTDPIEDNLVAYPYNSKPLARVRRRRNPSPPPFKPSSLGTSPKLEIPHKPSSDNQEDFQELRRKREVVFYRNGDRFFKGKKLRIMPQKYLSFDELLGELTKSVSLPYGVRRIYTPNRGTRVKDVQQLRDGQSYVCASFEKFRKLKYGNSKQPDWLPSKNAGGDALGYGSSYPSGGKYAAVYKKSAIEDDDKGVGTFASLQNIKHESTESEENHSSHTYPQRSMQVNKPKLVTVVKAGSRPRQTVSLLLNKKTLGSFEQLMTEISEAFGLPRRRHHQLNKLYSIYGNEIRGLGQFFRDQHVVVIGATLKEPLLSEDAIDIHKEYLPERLTGLKNGTPHGEKKQKLDSGFEEEVKDDTEGNQSSISGGEEGEKSGGISKTLDSRKLKNQKLKSLDNLEPNSLKPLKPLRAIKPKRPYPKVDSKEVEEKWKQEEIDAKRAEAKLLEEEVRRRIQEERERKRLKREAEAEKNQKPVPLKAVRAPKPKLNNIKSEEVWKQEEIEAKKAETKKLEEEQRRKVEEEQKRKREKREADLKRKRELEERQDAEKQKEGDARKNQVRKKKEADVNRERKKESNRKETKKSKPKGSSKSLEEKNKPEGEENTQEDVDREREIERVARIKAKEAIDLALQEEVERLHLQDQGGTNVDDDEINEKLSKKGGQCAQDNLSIYTFNTENNDKRRSRTPSSKRSHSGADGHLPDGDVAEKPQDAGDPEDVLRDFMADDENDADHSCTDGTSQNYVDEFHSGGRFKPIPRDIITEGDVFRKYSLGDKIGDGNFADVHVASHLETYDKFAVKIVDKSKLKNKESMIENEIAILKEIDHPNIIKLYEEFETLESIYLIMEYVRGGDLFDAIIDSVKFTETDAALMVEDLTEALGYLHEMNIVHRDMKPENLLVSKNSSGKMQLKLADFGLAMEVMKPIYTVCGTPTYVAPEILAETGYGLPVDMWALGVIMYILLCGFPPFRSANKNQDELFEIIQSGQFEYITPYWDNISNAAKDLIDHLLVVNQIKRFTAKQVLQHKWIKNKGSTTNMPDLHREVSMNLEKNFNRVSSAKH